jgi:dUTP pyrophosphatase
VRLEDAAGGFLLRLLDLRQHQRLLVRVELRVTRVRPGASLPAAQHPGDAGLDLRAVEAAVVEPGERAMIPTGVAVAIPDGHAGMVLPRSGLAARHGLTLANAPGLIDAGYRGEVIVAVVNLDRSEPVEIAAGDRIAQLVIVAVPRVVATWVDELPGTVRGEGGFGSTGRA